MDSRRNDLKRPCRKAFEFSRELLKKSKNLPGSRQAQEGTMNRKAFALGGGLLLIAVGIFLVFAWDAILESQVNKELILSEKSKTYQAWKKTRVDVFIKFYFWNWTNPSEIRDPDFKPVLAELGPYAYREITEKVNVVWNANGTVSYRRTKRWYFAPEKSNGTEDDLITTLNVVAKSAAFITRYSNIMTRMGLNVALSSTQTMEVVKPVRELLFEGYRNSLIEAAKNLPLFTKVTIPFDRFGWFYKRNGSADFDGIFNVETGINGMENFGKIRSWNYQNRTSYFENTCGIVRGSGGDFFPPKRTKNDVIELFSPDLCRYVTFRFAREEVVHGITAYRYEARSSMLDNGEEEEENSCFCAGECAPPGTQNVSSCRLGAPAFVSFPHFYLADSYYRNSVVGMKPDPARHGLHMTIEPTYGIPLEVEARFQINILVQPYSDLTFYKGLKPVYFPVMWFEQTAFVPENTVKSVKTLLLLPTIGMSVAAILIVSGTALVLVVISLRFCTTNRRISINDDIKKAGEPMINTDEKGKEQETTKWDTKL